MTRFPETTRRRSSGALWGPARLALCAAVALGAARADSDGWKKSNPSAAPGAFVLVVGQEEDPPAADPAPNQPQPMPEPKPELPPEAEPPEENPLEKKIVFSFSKTPWDVALTRFAELAELQLILKFKPPGTFDYQSTRAYTIPEALDVLNEILIAEGFAVLRTDRFLTLAALDQPLPLNQVPIVAADDLPKRGRNEFVTVVERLQFADPAGLEPEIRKLLGPYGTVQTVAALKLVRITDQASKIEEILPLIREMDARSKPKEGAPPPGPAPPPVRKIHPLKNLSPDRAIALAKAVLGTSGTLEPTPDGAGVIAVLPEGEHAALTSLLAEIDLPSSKGDEPTERSIPLEFARAEGVASTLGALFPKDSGVIVAGDASANTLVVKGPARILEEAAAIVAALDKRAQENAPVHEVYRPAGRDAAAVAAALQAAFVKKDQPDVAITLDADGQTILASAPPKIHAQIRAYLERMGAAAGESGETTSVVQLEHASASKLTETLATVFPKGVSGATFGAEEASNAIIVRGPASAVERITAVVKDLDLAPAVMGLRDRQEEIYQPQYAKPAELIRAAESLYPTSTNVVLVPAGGGAKIVVSAPPVLMPKVKATLDLLDRAAEKVETPTERSYTLRHADVAGLVRTLSEIFPSGEADVRFIPDAAHKRLMVVAKDPALHQRIAGLVNELDAPAPDAETLEVYDAQHVPAGELVATLERIFASGPDKATFQVQRDGGGVLIRASRPVQARVAELLAKIDVAPRTPGSEPVDELYKLKYAKAAELATSLQQLYPPASTNVRISAEPANNVLIVTAPKEVQERIRALLEKVDVPTDARMELRIYRSDELSPANLSSLVSQMGYSGLGTMATSADGRALLVVATKETQEKIASLVRLAATTDPAGEPVRKVYAVENVPGTTMASMLQTIFPAGGPSGATIVADPTGKQILVLAPPRVQEAVVEILKQSDVSTAMSETILSPKHVSANSLYTQLTGLYLGVDGTRFTLDSGSNTVGMLATPAMKEKVLAFVEKFDQPLDPASGRVRATYKIRHIPAANVYSALVTLYPAAETGISLNYENSNQILVAVGTAEQQARIQKEIERLDVDPRASWTTRGIRPKHVAAEELLKFLTVQLAAVANKSLSLGARDEEVVVSAPPEVQAEVDRLTGVFDAAPPEGVELVRRIYRPVYANAYYMYLNLHSLHPPSTGAKLSYDTYTNTVTAVADAKRQEEIARDVEALDENPRKSWVEKTIRPKQLTADQLLSTLTTALAGETNKSLSASPDGQVLIAIAPPVVMERIERLAATLDAAPAEGGETFPKAYVVKYASAGSVYTLLTQLFPPATSGVKSYYDSTNNTVTVVASPSVHERIETLVASMDVDPNAGRVERVYTPKRVPAPALATLLQAALASERATTIALGPQKQSVVVVAPPESQARIAKYIETLDSAEAVETTRQIYKLNFGNANYLVGTLQALYPPAEHPVTASADPANNLLVVEAPAVLQQKIGELIAELDVPAGGRTQVVYPLKHTRASSLLASLTAVLGGAQAAVVAGPDDQSVVVNALPAEHERVKSFLASFDTAANSQDPLSKVYNLRFATASNVARMLGQLYASEPKVRVTYDDQLNTLFVTAPPAIMAKIEPLVNDSDQEGLESRMENQIFRLRDASANDVSRALAAAFPDRKKAIFTADNDTKTVIARTLPSLSDDVKRLVEDIDQPRVLPEREVAVFDLYNTDPFEARGIVERLYEDLPRDQRPGLESTWDPPRLIVRAAAAQMPQIRDVISKVEGQASAGGAVEAPPPGAAVLEKPLERVVRVNDADPQATAEAIQQVWPLLRRNKLNVIYRQGPLKGVDPVGRTPPGEAADPPPVDLPAPDEAVLPGDPKIPVTVIVGNDRLTVASRDVEALDLLSSLADAWTRPFDPNRSASRVFYIENADVSEIAKAIDEAFNGRQERGEDRRRMFRPERVRIVAEPNSNALIVRASAVDLVNVKQLIDQLDIPPATEKRPRILALKSADAEDVLLVVQKVFADYLAPGSGPPLNVPGVTGQSARSRTTAMSVDIDKRSNSLIVSAPEVVVAEVERLVEGLESAATDAEKSYRVLPIENASPTDVRDALEILLNRQMKNTRGSAPARPTPNRRSRTPRTTRPSRSTSDASAVERGLVDASKPAAPARVKGTSVSTIRPTTSGAAVTHDGPHDARVRLVGGFEEDDGEIVAAGFQEAPEPAEPADARVGPLGGNVEITVLEDIGYLLLIGNERDLETLAEIVREIEKAAKTRELTFELFPLAHAKASALATLLNDLYARLLDSRGQLTRVQAQATVIPLAKPNALLLVAGKDEIGELTELAKKFDAPVAARGEYRIFRLRHVRAALLVQTIESFYEGRTQDGEMAQEVVVQPDDRSNSLVVYAGPNDMAEIAGLVRELDTAQTARVNELRIFYLRHTVATELAQVLEQAIAGRVGGAAATTATTAAGRSLPALAFRDPDDPDRTIDSGILENVSITPNRRANAVLVAAPRQSLRVVESLIRQLDVLPEAVAEIKVFTLVNSDAATLLQTLRTLFLQLRTQQGDVALASAAGGDGSNPLIELSFSIDERTNSILASGSREQLEVVEAIILRLDASDIEERRTDVYRLKNAPAQDVAPALTELLSQQQQLAGVQEGTSIQQQLEREIIVVPEPISNSLLISASPRYYDRVTALIEKLDDLPPQVVIQVLLAQVQLDGDAELGVELGLQDGILFDRSNFNSTSVNRTGPYFNDGSTPGFNFNTGGPLGDNILTTNPAAIGTQGLSNFAVGRANDTLGYGGLVLSASSESVSILIRALARERRLEVLSRPQIMTLDNQQASILVGAEVPRITGSNLVQGAGVSQNVEYVPSGIILEVTPKINPDGTIVMLVSPEISRLAPANDPDQTVTISPGVTARALEVTKATTTVSTMDGQTVVIGGLIRKSTEKEERKVPCLGDVPYLGHLFRYDRLTERRTELLIILTPHVIRSQADADRIKATEAARMNWCLSDVEKVHGDLGLPTEVYLGDAAPGELDGEAPEGCLPEEFEEAVPPQYEGPILPPPPAGSTGASSPVRGVRVASQSARLKTPVVGWELEENLWPADAPVEVGSVHTVQSPPRPAPGPAAPPDAQTEADAREKARKARAERDAKIYQPLMEKRRGEMEAWKTKYLPWKRKQAAP